MSGGPSVAHRADKEPLVARVEKKVAAAGVSGAAVTVRVYVAGLLGLEMPAEVAAAVVTVVSAVVACVVPHTSRAEAPGADVGHRGQGVGAGPDRGSRARLHRGHRPGCG